MRIGFTGTQRGMTAMQEQMVFDETMLREPDEVHHGCCIGADEEFDILMGYARTSCSVHGHPPTNTAKMAQCYVDVMHPPKDYLIRNRDIVDATDCLIAAPEGPETLRSGTWSTVRYAKKAGKPVIIVWPDGTVTGV